MRLGLKQSVQLGAVGGGWVSVDCGARYARAAAVARPIK